jgi:hypothetical protein
MRSHEIFAATMLASLAAGTVSPAAAQTTFTAHSIAKSAIASPAPTWEACATCKKPPPPAPKAPVTKDQATRMQQKVNEDEKKEQSADDSLRTH